jgi:hypothetical protein
MAAPIIDSVTVAYPAGKTSLAPGETATITVMATHPDHPLPSSSEELTVTITVTDKDGNKSAPTDTIVQIVTGGGTDPNDPLTYSATAPSGTIGGGGASNVITFKA